jgi:Flp pilus assembly protein TadG
VIDLGRAYHTYITLINASREGARYAVNHPYDTAGIELAVRREAQNSQVDLSAATITISNQGSGGPVHVTVQVDFYPILGNVLGISSIPIRASTVFRAR